jgi:ribose-phosphate pyrophosphokinase
VKDYLVIDSDNYAEHGIQTFMFPGGEPHVKIPDFGGKNLLLFLKLRTWNDVGYAAMLLDALAEQEQRACVVSDTHVFVPYFPGARQDRSDGFSPLTLTVTVPLLASSHVALFDPHSAATAGWVERWQDEVLGAHWPAPRTLMPSDLDLSTLPYYKGVIAPDKGALFRAMDFAAVLPGKPSVFECEKEREFGTGRITKYTAPLLAPGHYLVVDDICDGGATFNMLADEVKQQSNVYLDLWVSHGIFSKGVGALLTQYGRIYTTDSWYKGGYTDAAVTVFSLKQLFNKIMES